MTKELVMEKALELYEAKQINEEVYNGIASNIDIFTDEDEFSDGLPNGYAEIEYDDFDNAEAIDGAAWDDMNYLHYTER